jgi:hypothetical protein
MTESPGLIPCERSRLLKEYADGDAAYRFLIAPEDADAFFELMPDVETPCFLANGRGAIEAVRDTVQTEFADGSLAVKIRIGPADKARFRELWPRIGAEAVLARENPQTSRSRLLRAQAQPEPQYGAFAKALRLHTNFMLNPTVWRCVGSDEDYLNWLRTKPCAVCKWKPHWEMTGYAGCEPAHVRRIRDGAGVARKPEYSAIPLCPTRNAGKVVGCHAKQHQHGESAIGGEEAVDLMRIRHVQEWVWETLKGRLGYEHWNEVPPETLLAWAREVGVVEYLPRMHIEAAGASETPAA